jgi:ribonuclease HIII
VSAIASYTRVLDGAQARALEDLLRSRGYRFDEVPHARFAAEGRDVKVVFYQSGKLVVQGKGTEEFVQFVLEPEVLGRAELGYEELLKPELTLPRLGVDESGKGDLFGPLCVAGVYLNADMIGAWKQAGIRDSKSVSSDQRIARLAEVIRTTRGCVTTVLDQVASSTAVVTRALMAAGRQLEIIQRHKAESDLAVAAASILARDEFVQRLKRLGEDSGVPLPKGAGPEAGRALAAWVERNGRDRLGEVAKLHFRNVAALSGG